MAVAQSPRKRCHEDVDYGEANKKLHCSSELTSERIRIAIEQTSATFSLAAAQLYSSSEYFKRILDSDWWKEKKPTTLPLLGTSQKAFGIYVNWLESGKVDIRNEVLDEGIHKYTDEELGNIHQCYELAGFLQDDNFKDAMIDAMITNLAAEEVVMQDLPKVVYACSDAQSPQRKFVVDCVINTWGQSFFDEMPQENYPQQFLLDLVIAMGSKIRSGVPLTRSNEFFKDIDTCKYHEHTKKKAHCYKTKQKNLP